MFNAALVLICFKIWSNLTIQAKKMTLPLATEFNQAFK
ncbi:hypothetical protein M23134_02632 [Microscilla marina ATCC 23134]|uniref:Uncharacterized protein n=1 Tax=Microscilla marina ATCC 23134 TaxID=313606 RepID=A1ZNS4_MICM2|nr:hypothetical protein M23134_02632 [Microscilla marina ATCC 23134]